MILTRPNFWELLNIRSADLFAPVLAVSSRTGGGEIIRARSFGEDLWTGTITLAPGTHEDIRRRRALLMLAQQPGVRIVADDRSYTGEMRTGVTLKSVASDNRTIVLAGMAGATLKAGDYIDQQRHFHTITAVGGTTGGGDMTVEIMPHARFSISIDGPVEIRNPGFLAVIDRIRPAMFEAVVAGEASFTITQSWS